MNNSSILTMSGVFFIFLFGVLRAGGVTTDTTLNGMHIQLHVLPAEPFFTKDQVSKGNVKEGMLIIGGAKPLPPDAESKPNSHLVIHVFDALTDKAITNAKVKMSYQTGQSDRPVEVPVVVMQAIGKGEQSTHYGNNVSLPDGPLTISLIVNGRKLKLKVTIPYESAAPMEDMPVH